MRKLLLLAVLPLAACATSLTAEQQAAIMAGTSCVASTTLAVHTAVTSAPAGTTDKQKAEIAAAAAVTSLTSTQPCQQALSAGLAAATKPAGS